MRRAAAAVLIVFALVSVSLAFSAQTESQWIGRQAPDFKAANVDGRELTLKGLLGGSRAVIVCFWGLRCGACIAEIPSMNALARKYRDRVAVLGVNTDAVDGAALKDFMKEGGIAIEYEVVPDPDFKLVDAFKLTAAPLTVVIDREGVVRSRHEDYKAGDEVKLEQALLPLLEK